jgi:trigger factor
MQVSIETTTGLERRLTIGVPAERIEQEIDKRLKKAAGTVRIDGFRPGKVPMKVIRQRFGSGVRQEVVGEVMSQTFYEAVMKEELQPAGQPKIEPREMAPGKDLQYVATFEIYPEIALADLTRVSVTKPVAEVTDADVDRMIEMFRKQQGAYEVVERAAANEDEVNIDYKGTRDGEPFEGGSAEGTDLVLGSGRMIPGFEEGLLGLRAGEEKTLELQFPEEYHNEELKGAEVQFQIRVNAVKEHRPAELNEDFFSRYGVSSGGEEEFRQQVADNMRRELKKAVTTKVKQQVMDQLTDMHDVQLPSALVQGEVEVLRKQMLQQFGEAAAQFDASVLPDEMFKEQAERRVSLGLILGELIKSEALKADPEKVKAMVEEIAATYQDPAEVVKYYYGNEELLRSVESAVLEDEAVEKILAMATIEEVGQSYEEAVAPKAPAVEAKPEESPEESAEQGQEAEK